MRMSELLNEVRRFELDEGFSPREIKMAIGIASGPRYAKGNMTGAVTAIEKMKKGLSKHPQVAAVLQRQNEDVKVEEAVSPTHKMPDGTVMKGKKHKDEKDEGNEFGMALKSARDKGEKTFVVSGKKYNVTEEGEASRIVEPYRPEFGLDEAPKMTYALVGTDMKIYAIDSDERNMKLNRRSLEKRFKDVSPLKIARLKTAQSIGDTVDKSQLKEETLGEKFTKKDFRDNEDSNHHTENGVEIVNMYGTPAEKKLMAQIAKNHDKNRGISEKEQKLRDAMVKKYYSKLESVEIDEAMYHHVLKGKVVASGSKSDMMKLVKKNGATVHKGADSNYILNSPGAKVGDIKEEDLDEKYDLYHKDFSSAMQHAYDYAKSKMGITVDPKEIDSKVATGPKKPTEGKTNKYMLKGKGGNLQIQVYNKGGSKPFELNMYKEENDLIAAAVEYLSND
jgi:hypothetical protein